MRTLTEWISRIGPPDEAAGQAAQERWNSIAKPLGSLGQFETAVTKIASLRGDPEIRLTAKTLLVFCADNGVVAQGVSQCGDSVTAKVAVALAENRSTASAMATDTGCRVIPADMGMRDFQGHSGVVNLRVRNASGDISRESAMSREECIRAMELAADLVERLAGEGTDLLAIGEMGIGNTTTTAALSAVLLDRQPEEVTGRGAGLSTDGLEHKIKVIRQALTRCTADRNDPIGLIAELGGLDIAGMCGAFIGAAACRVPVIMDGCISAAAALCAARLCPGVKTALLASHVSAEPAGRMILRELGLHAPIDAGLRLGEGSGALMLMPLLDMVIRVYQSGQSFERLGIDPYRALS
ncbi:MAG: nicotinate-nucleotide--dimethylbenzimidazole phosphoribosyltransferase [Oscillospiraceae bacterium]|nr:nicotinate-nucleotide--dimethylbenzimidazole phosphoribosyltransferase [Oscillospiraceae bacterium]